MKTYCNPKNRVKRRLLGLFWDRVVQVEEICGFANGTRTSGSESALRKHRATRCRRHHDYYRQKTPKVFTTTLIHSSSNLPTYEIPLSQRDVGIEPNTFADFVWTIRFYRYSFYPLLRSPTSRIRNFYFKIVMLTSRMVSNLGELDELSLTLPCCYYSIL
jgi:hypothetical protein